MIEDWSSWPWGWLPLAVPLVIWIALRFAAKVLGEAPLHERVVGAAVWGTAFVVLSAWLLALLGLFNLPTLLLTWLVTAGLLGRPREGWRRWWPRFEKSERWSMLWPLGVAMFALGVAGLTAYWLPVWPWDSLGYHLPYVNFLIQGGGTEGVPLDVPYLSTYPHGAELVFAVLRLLLPDDRLIDLGQIPFGLLGGVGVAGFARAIGARPVDAVVAGALWWTLPAVFLQLPTNYVDVAAAAALLWACAMLAAPMRLPTVLTAAAAIGLYLGMKPSAPTGTVILCALLFFRLGKTRQFGWAFAAAAVIVLLGGEAYLANLLRHGNPIWPVMVDVGPLHLPGIETLDKLLSSGAGTYKISGPLPLRIIRSWTSLTAPPMFDMRVGGFGPLFLLALPLGLVCLVQRRLGWVVILLLASVAAPDPALARYVFGFPGLLFGLSAALPAWTRTGPAVQHAVRLGLAVMAGWNLVYAWPGLTGEGPPLSAYARMDWSERLGAVGGEGPPTDLLKARRRLQPGEGAAFDKAMDFPYLLWTPHLENRVVRIPDHATAEEVAAILERENVRIVGAGPGTPLGDYVTRPGSPFVPFHDCNSADCVLYWRS